MPLLQAKLLVGRQSACDVPVCFNTVSSRHCELELIDGYWHVRDLGSRNGIRVNGARCESQRLAPDDVLSVADRRYKIVYSPPDQQPGGQAAPSAKATPERTASRPPVLPSQPRAARPQGKTQDAMGSAPTAGQQEAAAAPSPKEAPSRAASSPPADQPSAAPTRKETPGPVPSAEQVPAKAAAPQGEAREPAASAQQAGPAQPPKPPPQREIPAREVAPAAARPSAPPPRSAVQGPTAVPGKLPTAAAKAAPSSTPQPPIAPGMPFGELIPCGGGQPIPLRKPRLVIGRQRGCDIVLRFLTVSPRHCQLEWTEGRWLVRDLGSANGVQVDGVRCEANVLAEHSVLWIADQRYRVVYTHRGR